MAKEIAFNLDQPGTVFKFGNFQCVICQDGFLKEDKICQIEGLMPAESFKFDWTFCTYTSPEVWN